MGKKQRAIYSADTWHVDDGTASEGSGRPNYHCTGIRRSFSAEYKLAILAEYDGCTETGEKAGPTMYYIRRIAPSCEMSNTCRIGRMGEMIDVDDLIDASGVADLIGLAHRNTVSQYQRIYPDMPRPVIDLGKGRCKLWVRSEIADWSECRGH